MNAFEIERRREQFNKQYGQLFVPLPYSLPGLGTGLLFIGNFGNIGNIGFGTNIFGFLAIFLAAINIFGGFLVTHRMLQMYKKKKKK